MKTAGWRQRGRLVDFIVNCKKICLFYYFKFGKGNFGWEVNFLKLISLTGNLKNLNKELY